MARAPARRAIFDAMTLAKCRFGMKGEPEWFDLSDSKVAAHQIEVNLSMMLSRRKGADAGGWGGRGCA